MGKMSEYVTLRECPKCGGEPREAMQDYTYAVSVCCSVCSHGTRWCGNAAQAWAEWDKLTDPALAVKDARIVELEAELAALKDRTCHDCVFWDGEYGECERHRRSEMPGLLREQGCPDWREPTRRKEEA